MKTFLLKIVLIATAVFAGGGAIAPTLASAEETQESVENIETENISTEQETSEIQPNIADETDGSKWFDETIKPMIIQYGAGVLAFVTSVCMMLKDLNKTKTTLGVAVGELTKSNEGNILTAQLVAQMRAEFQAEFERCETEYNERMTQMSDMFMNILKEIKESLGDKVTDIDEVAHKLLDMEMIAYGDNAQLVSNGTAKRIAEVVKHGKAKDKK